MEYEGLAEVVVSRLLERSSIEDFVKYETVRIRYLVENVEETTGLRDFGKYLTAMLELNALGTLRRSLFAEALMNRWTKQKSNTDSSYFSGFR